MEFDSYLRGVNLVGNLGGWRQTAFGSKLLTRKTGRVETSDTVEDKNKNVYIITVQLKLKHICTIFGGTWRITAPSFDFWRVPPVPRGIYAPELPVNSQTFFNLPSI